MTAVAGGKIQIADVAAATSPYFASVSRSTAQSISHSSVVSISWTSEDADTDGIFSSGTNLTLQHSGIYGGAVSVYWDSSYNDYSRLLVMFYVNGGEVGRQELRTASMTGVGMSLSFMPRLLSASDIITARVLHTNSSTAARNINTASLSICYMGDGS